MPEEPGTYFLPPDRLDRDRILAIAREIAASPSSVTLGLVPLAVIIVNETRQIVYANERFLSLIGATGFEDVAGKRPGEALGCSHAWETGGGCGTSRFCRYCGAAKAIVKSLGGDADTQECSIIRRTLSQLDALNLQVWTAPFAANHQGLVLSSILNIAHEKSLRSLERVFFHDIMNAVSGIKGLHDIFSMELPPKYGAELELLHIAVESIRDIIESHKDFSEVEAREYQRTLAWIESRDLLHKLASYCLVYNPDGKKQLLIADEAASLPVFTDIRILQRVLVNMVKNALEASKTGDTVTLACQKNPADGVTFWVHNPAVMTEEVQLRVFEKAFSTKGRGRGFGTYGMRLFAETCLGGQIRFTSEPGHGTTFSLDLPPGT